MGKEAEPLPAQENDDKMPSFSERDVQRAAIPFPWDLQLFGWLKDLQSPNPKMMLSFFPRAAPATTGAQAGCNVCFQNCKRIFHISFHLVG